MIPYIKKTELHPYLDEFPIYFVTGHWGGEISVSLVHRSVPIGQYVQGFGAIRHLLQKKIKHTYIYINLVHEGIPEILKASEDLSLLCEFYHRIQRVFGFSRKPYAS